jgi:L-threonylcarbamoyladenylate synthase
MIPEATLAHLRTGGTVAYPTTTLPGLACLPMASALDGLYALKRRSADKPVSLAVLDLEQASRLVKVPPIVAELEAAFPKGGITFVLDALQPLDPRLGGGRVAVRCLAHPVARALVEAVGPITATSANEAGEVPEPTAEAAGAGLGLPPEAVLQGACPGGLGSTFLGISEGVDGLEVTVMREGVVPPSSVMEWWTNRTSSIGETPGMSPDAPLRR